MIYGLTHPGSGLGNQLHRYVATRVLALDKGYEFSMIGKDYFKGSTFMNPHMGINIEMPYLFGAKDGSIKPSFISNKWKEETKYYNPEFNFIPDGTVIDGEFQDERYFEHRMKEVDEWLKVEPITIADDVCVIGFRGGEYYLYPELGLPKSYFDEGIRLMREINPDMRFEVHTDDKELARHFFPDLNIIQDIGINWCSMRYAKYAIIANSSFYIFPRLLRQRQSEGRIERVNGHAVTIAPRYWARRNTGEWSMPQNFYKSFKYI